MTALTLEVIGQPAAQGSKRALAHRSTGRVVTIESGHDRVQTWRGDVIRAVTTALPGIDNDARNGAPFLNGPLVVTITFRFNRPKGHYRTGRNSHLLRATAPTHPAGKPDLDKLLRSTFDALTTSRVWRDDAQVVRLNDVSKQYVDGPTGALIRIATVDHPTYDDVPAVEEAAS